MPCLNLGLHLALARSTDTLPYSRSRCTRLLAQGYGVGQQSGQGSAVRRGDALYRSMAEGCAEHSQYAERASFHLGWSCVTGGTSSSQSGNRGIGGGQENRLEC